MVVKVIRERDAEFVTKDIAACVQKVERGVQILLNEIKNVNECGGVLEAQTPKKKQ